MMMNRESSSLAGAYNKARSVVPDLVIQVVIAICLVIYAGCRAATVGLVYDEVCSYVWYAHGSLIDLYLGIPADANNHILNSLFMKVSLALLGPRELVLRWHSVAAFAIYLTVVIVWLRAVRGPLLRLAGFMLLACNPYLMDFFSLARGYGLAMTLVLASAFCLSRWLSGGCRRWLWSTLILAGSAVLANLCTLNFYAAIVAVTGLTGAVTAWISSQTWRGRSTRLWTELNAMVWVTCGMAAILFLPMMRLLKAKAFGVGGANGFWVDTVRSLISSSFYRNDYGGLMRWLFYGVEAVIVLTMLTGFMLLAIRLNRHGLATLREPWAVMLNVTGITALSSIVLHLGFGVNYLTDRLATFFVPLYMFHAVFLIDTLLTEHKERPPERKRAPVVVPPIHKWRTVLLKALPAGGRLFAGAVIVASGIHFARSANLKWTHEWRYDWRTREVLSLIQADAARDGNRRGVRIAVSFLFHPSAGYYRDVRGLKWISALEKNWETEEFDYYYVKDGLDNHVSRLPAVATLRVYPDIAARLLKRVHSP
jgi:hypothetical protein